MARLAPRLARYSPRQHRGEGEPEPGAQRLVEDQLRPDQAGDDDDVVVLREEDGPGAADDLEHAEERDAVDAAPPTARPKKPIPDALPRTGRSRRSAIIRTNEIMAAHRQPRPVARMMDVASGGRTTATKTLLAAKHTGTTISKSHPQRGVAVRQAALGEHETGRSRQGRCARPRQAERPPPIDAGEDGKEVGHPGGQRDREGDHAGLKLAGDEREHDHRQTRRPAARSRRRTRGESRRMLAVRLPVSAARVRRDDARRWPIAKT